MQFNNESCKRLDCESIFETKKKCSLCNLKLKNEKCAIIHQESFCMKNKICPECYDTYNKNHVCGDDQKWCNNCN